MILTLRIRVLVLVNHQLFLVRDRDRGFGRVYSSIAIVFSVNWTFLLKKGQEQRKHLGLAALRSKILFVRTRVRGDKRVRPPRVPGKPNAMRVLYRDSGKISCAGRGSSRRPVHAYASPSSAPPPPTATTCWQPCSNVCRPAPTAAAASYVILLFNGSAPLHVYTQKEESQKTVC